MKYSFYLSIFISTFLFSCSPNDSNTAENNTNPADYFPLKIANYWTYNVDTAGTINNDSIFVAKDTMINNLVHQKIESNVTPFGFMSNSLNNNSVRINGDKILLTGKPNLNFIAALPLDIKLVDFVIFKAGATENETLSTVTGTINQVYNSYPIKINYSLKSVAQVDFPTFTSPNAAVFKNVKAVKTILNVTVMSSIGIFPVVVLEPQDVIVSTQYFAKNIGVVHATTVYNYTLTAGLGNSIGIPQTGNQVIKEFIATFKVN